ncbi:MAG: T9SS type A sorting domain-containing protein [Sphingobacteriales bacterium]|jgi:hypothetical protein|nr:MAG: T9SS type A sorting domain-containing protein [Sphingobacteriales bacterium]
MKNIILLLLILVFCNLHAEDINIDDTKTNNILPKLFTGAGMADVLSGLNFEVDPDNQEVITNTYFNAEYLATCKALKISDYRFPEGTGGNYFHFYGKGSGLDTTEIYCNETYYGIGGAKISQYRNAYNFEQKLEKNYAHYFADFMQKMATDIPDVGFYYHLNSHTHIYKGHLKNASQAIQYLIQKYFNQNNALLNTKYDALLPTVDTNQIKIAIDALDKLKNDSIIKIIKDSLVRSAGFQYSFQENMNSIRFFKSKNLKIKGIEIGNETEAEYMLFDDDFSHFPYQCNASDTSLENPFSELLFRDYLEGLVKNWILITLYADSIHQNFNIPIGVTVGGVRANVGFNTNNEPYLLAPFGNLEKSAFFWSKFFSRESKIDALIPHIYTPRFIDCDKYTELLNTMSVNEINNSGIKFIDFYIETSLPYFLNAVSKTVGGKPLWITEWNFNFHSFVPNTFLHSYFLIKAIAKQVEFYENNNQYNVKTWLLHYLSSPYFAFALIKSGYDRNANYSIDKMLPYEAYYIWNKTLSDSCKKLNTTLTANTSQKTNNQIFINQQKDKVYIHFTNLSTNDDFYSLKNIQFISNQKKYVVDKVSTHQLVAKTYIASNYVECNALRNQIPNSSYKIVDTTKNFNDTLLMPAYSIGSFCLHLKEDQTTNITNTQKKNELSADVFPIPNKDYININIHSKIKDNIYQIEIADMNGNVVISTTSNENNNKIDVSKFPSGMYIINIVDKKMNHFTTKTVIF